MVFKNKDMGLFISGLLIGIFGNVLATLLWTLASSNPIITGKEWVLGIVACLGILIACYLGFVHTKPSKK